MATVWRHEGGVDTVHCHLDRPFVNMNMIRFDVTLLEDDVFHDLRTLKRVFGNTVIVTVHVHGHWNA